MTARLLLAAVVAALALAVHESTAAIAQYYVINSTTTWNPSSTLASAQTLCQNTINTFLGYSDDANIFPFLSGASGISSWSDTASVFSLRTGQLISTGLIFKGGAFATSPVFAGSLRSLGVCSGDVWTGLGTNFGIAGTCTSWSDTAGTARQGSCISAQSTWIADGNNVACDNTSPAPILCIYAAATLSPTGKPSRTPSRTPTVSNPTVSPATSKPSIAPATSKPSKAPATSKPSKSPAIATPLPTFEPAITDPSTTDSNLIAIPIGVGVGGAVIFLFILGLILITRSRNRKRQQQSLSVNNGK